MAGKCGSKCGGKGKATNSSVKLESKTKKTTKAKAGKSKK